MRRDSPESKAGRFGAPIAIAIAAFTTPAAAELRARHIGSFDRPVQVAVAPGRPELLFVVETAGRIQVMRDERRLARPFLDIERLVLGPPDAGAGGEQGLFSIAFPPDYERSGLFYVAFTNADGSLEVDEFRRVGKSAMRADPQSRRKVIAIPHPGATNHNGGQLQFGPDGLLYISVGDGGAVLPIGENARNLDSLLGKILRIDPRKAGSRSYGVPKSNPFVGRTGRGEIFAYGLRNPWRFSFDGKKIAIADVGEGRIEEINFLPIRRAAGANFGWPQYEGREVFDNSRPGEDLPTFPALTYGHEGGACSVTGGYVVSDPSLRELRGRYVYGDFCTGEVRSFKPGNPGGDRPTGLVVPQLSGFGQGTEGRIYLVQLGGDVSRLVSVP